MEDVPWNMPKNAYGVFEPEGLCIWINEDHQSDLGSKNTGVLSHEFTHYMHSLSTVHCVDDLLTLVFFVHAGIQRLEDLTVPVSLPLSQWSRVATCPPEVRNYIRNADLREEAIRDSLGRSLDSKPPKELPSASLYTKGRKFFIKTSATTGVPVARLALMEGAALAKKCEALGNDSDLKAKKRHPSNSHYFAVYDACTRANPRIDPLATSALLCDISLCTHRPSVVFEQGLTALSSLPPSATVKDFEAQLSSLYDKECRGPMNARLTALEQARAALPVDHRPEDNPSWAELALRNAIAAVRLRQEAPFSLIRPMYLGRELFELASIIGSPVIVTNDMRLSSLTATSEGTTHARNAVRTLSYICRWLLEEEGPLRCPYAGCPGCPEVRRGAHCATNAAIALLPPDDQPWCALLFSAHQLRVADLLRREAVRT